MQARVARHRAASRAAASRASRRSASSRSSRRSTACRCSPRCGCPSASTREGEAVVRRRLLERHGIEVGGGLGKLAGRIWRVGLMGENARPEVVDRLLAVLAEELRD